MKKIFISQGMINRTEEEIRVEREECIKDLRDFVKEHFNDDIEIIDSIIEEDPPEGCNAGVWFLGQSLILMSKADFVALLPRWVHYRGCRIEAKTADDYGIPQIVFDDDAIYLCDKSMTS